MLANQLPGLVERLTLVASFADSPMPGVGRFLPWSILVRVSIPRFIARRYFVGSDHEMASKLIDAISHTSPTTLAKRIRLLTTVDVCTELSQLHCPICYVRPTIDRLVPQRCVDKIARVNRRVKICEIDGPHLIMQTRPSQVWSAIENDDANCPDNNAMHRSRGQGGLK